jgi:NADH-quinone oxidoreductase subunit J
MTVLFFLASAVAVVSSVLVITRRSAVHALLYLIVSLLAVALVFFLLGAPFAAALEVIIYAGAIMVLFIFVVMVLGFDEKRPAARGPWTAVRAWVGPSVMAAVLLVELGVVLVSGGVGSAAPAWIPPQAVGVSLFSAYALGVELVAMLLLAAAVGAFHIGRKLKDGDRGEKGGERP